MSLYNLKRLAQDTFMIAKFTDDFEVESTYTLTAKGFSYLCDCPANNRAVVTKPCRHKLMMPTLLPKVDTDEFYDHDTGRFSTPLGDLFWPTADLEGQEALPVVGEALRAEVELTGKAKYNAACAGILKLKADGTLDRFHADMQQLITAVEGEAPGSPVPTELPTIAQGDYSPRAGVVPSPAPTIRRR